MLKLHASFSKKVPVKGQDYSSQSYHATVEAEVPDGLTADQLRDRIRQTFDLVRSSVEDELRRPDGEPRREPAPEPARFPESGDGGGDRARKADPPATARQLKFLADLAARRKIPRARLEDEVGRRYGVEGVERLSKRQASELLDSMNENASANNERRRAA